MPILYLIYTIKNIVSSDKTCGISLISINKVNINLGKNYY